MSDLDGKLHDILMRLYQTGYAHGDAGYKGLDETQDWSGATVPQIHKAYAEAGYIDASNLHQALRDKGGLLSGQEWYHRFLAEYHNKADWIASDPDMGPDAEHDVLLCARLAAGIDDIQMAYDPETQTVNGKPIKPILETTDEEGN